MTFIILTKINSAKCFSNTQVAGLDKIFLLRKLSVENICNYNTRIHVIFSKISLYQESKPQISERLILIFNECMIMVSGH